MTQGAGRVRVRSSEFGTRNGLALTPALSHRMGEGVRRTGEGQFRTPHSAFRIGVVRKLHDVVEALVPPANVKDGDQVRMGARDRFVSADAVELALERAGIAVVVAPDDFDRAKRA